MTTQSNAIPDSDFQSHVIAPAVISPARLFYWSLRRELIEARSIYLAPLAVGAISLLGFLIALVHMHARLRAATDSMQQHTIIEQPFVTVATMLMAIDIIVAVFYSLDALYGERRDRSILFWKSLPVSDLTTVLAKASIPILVLPLIASAVTIALQFVMLLVSSAVLAGSGMSASMVWTHIPILKTAGINLYHLVVFHGIWYAPFYAWCLMVSAWAKRTPFLWAVLPPVVVGLVEKIAFNTTHFGTMILQRVGVGSGTQSEPKGMTMDMFAPHHAVHFLFSPEMWLGLLFTAACLFAAAHLRRNRGPI
jgi:ABC-2 type transport system permease protein